MGDSKRNPCSPEAGLAHGVPSQSPTSRSPVEAPVEATEGDHGNSSGRAPDPDAFMWNDLELDSPIDGKMESVSLIGSPDTLLPDDMWDVLELASPIDGRKMESVCLIGSSDNRLPDAGVSVVEGEGRRDEPLPEDDDTDGDDGSDRSEVNDSESGESSESDESSSEDSDSSTSTSSEEEDEGSDRSHGVGGRGVEEVPTGSDEEEEVANGPIKSKNEIEVLPSVAQVKVSLEPRHQTIPVGVISSVLGNRVVIESSANHKALNEGSILWITETRSPLGIIDEIFGPVKNPYYVVRYNSEEDVPTGINNGTAVSFVMDFANYVLYKDLNKKGYDPSGEDDEEISDEVEFSDDEKEAEYKKAMRQAKRGTDDRKFEEKEKGFSKKSSYVKGAGAKKGMMPHGPHAHDPAKRGTDDRNFEEKEKGFSKKSSYVKGAGAKKGMMPHGPHAHDPGNIVQPVPGQNGPYMTSSCTASLPVSLVGDLSNPSYQQPQQPNAILDRGMLFPQQMNASTVYQMPLPMSMPMSMPMPMPMPMQQQENPLWPLGFLPQQLLNPILTHGIQHRPIAGMPGLQMNWPPNQQLRNEVYLEQHQKHGFMDNHFRMPSQHQLLQMFGTPAMPQMGPSNSSIAGLVPPMLVGQFGAGQASSVHAEQGVLGVRNPQFNPGSSSVRGRMPRPRGGRSFRRGK